MFIPSDPQYRPAQITFLHPSARLGQSEQMWCLKLSEVSGLMVMSEKEAAQLEPHTRVITDPDRISARLQPDSVPRLALKRCWPIPNVCAPVNKKSWLQHWPWTSEQWHTGSSCLWRPRCPSRSRCNRQFGWTQQRWRNKRLRLVASLLTHRRSITAYIYCHSCYHYYIKYIAEEGLCHERQHE